MRYGIFSDIHGNWEAYQAVVSAFKKEIIDQFICVGDVVGYGANPKECIKLTKKLKAKTVAGNHDWAVAELFGIEYFNPSAKEAILWTKEILNTQDMEFLKNLPLVHEDENIICVHGSLDHPEDFNYLIYPEDSFSTFSSLFGNICFIGHTHIPLIFGLSQGKILAFDTNNFEIKANIKYICNVGSVGQPRDGNSQAAYCVYDTKKKLVEIKRISYNVDKAQSKIRKAKLPEFLAKRLNQGR